jgi:hypothetical protein
VRRGASCVCGGGCPRCSAHAADRSTVAGFDRYESSQGAPFVLRGSASRLANETEAESAARAVANIDAPPSSSPEREPLPSLPSTDFVAEASAGSPLPTPIRGALEHTFGYDLGAVRLHDDPATRLTARGMGAAAFASGAHIGLAGPRYAPNQALGRHIVAHEVAHVIQGALQPAAPAIHLYESPEHEDIGDVGLADLLDFLQTDDGRAWATKRGLDAAALVKQIQADPLKAAGGKITAGVRKVGDKGDKEKVGLTPGEVIALSGDFYKTPDDIASAASAPLGKAGDMNELDKLRAAIGQERKGQLTNANETYEKITGGRYITLAKSNDAHFAPVNRTEWRRLHDQAIAEAKSGKDDGSLQHALLVDAAGGHFLTDSYASGHLFKKNEVLAAIQLHLATHPLRTENPEAQTYAGIVTLSGNADQLVLKNIHDRMNVEGFDVTNARGMSWRTFGDAQLAKAPDTERIASLAIFLSRQQIYAARRGEPTDATEVEGLMPDDSTLERATKQAIGYIPAAAADVQGLMYRQRAFAKSQFPPVIGSIISANLATIASPARERQLLDLQATSEATKSGPLLAPQATLLEW